MKLIIKCANELIVDYNKELVAKKKNSLLFPAEQQKYIDDINKLVDKCKLPLIDDDVTPDDLIDYICGLQESGLIKGEDEGYEIDFLESLQSKVFNEMVQSILESNPLTQEILAYLDIKVVYAYIDKWATIFDSAKHPNDCHFILRNYFEHGMTDVRLKCFHCGEEDCNCENE